MGDGVSTVSEVCIACGFGVGLLAGGLYEYGWVWLLYCSCRGFYGLCDVIVSTWTFGTLYLKINSQVSVFYSTALEGGREGSPGAD